MAGQIEGADAAKAEAEARRSDAERALALAEAALAEAQAAASDLNARRNALNAGLIEETRRLQRFENELAASERERAALTGADADERAFQEASAMLETSSDALAEAEAQALAAEAEHAQAREAEAHTRSPLNEAERRAQRLETEARTLNNLLGSAAGAQWPPVVDEISVARGYEAAIGAALGEDLEASTRPDAPAHWSQPAGPHDDPDLPEGVESLAVHVEAPLALARRLAQIGVVTREQGQRLSPYLKPGQRLVSKEGDFWRWDGFVAAAEAPTPAARRLAEKNRLGELKREAEAARAGRRSGEGRGGPRAVPASGSRRARGRGAPARPRRPGRPRRRPRKRSPPPSAGARRR